MKKTVIVVIILCVSLMLICHQYNSHNQNDGRKEGSEIMEKKVITVVAPKSPTTIPVLRMIESNVMGENVEINLQIYRDMESMITMASKGEYEILIVPAHTAANLNNKGIDVKMINVFNWGGMYLSTTEPSVNNWRKLKGKEIYIPSKGSVPDVLTQYFLQQNGMTIGENVDVVYSSHVEIAQLLSTGIITYAVDAQPYVTLNSKSVKNYTVISKFSDEWKKIQGDEYNMPATCMVTRSEYLNENEELVGSFSQKFSEAIEWTKENPTEAGALANSKLNANAELIATAMPEFCFEYKSAACAQKDLEEYYKVLMELKPESIGGKIPSESFYYKNEKE